MCLSAIGVELPFSFLLKPEAHVAIWQEYAAQAIVTSAFESLKNVLVQLQFPIKEGISQTEAYRAATRKGIDLNRIPEATGLVFKQPEQLQLTIHQSLAGAIPVLLVKNREDFVSLLQAITKRNEPIPIPASMGACMVAGYNNWDRISPLLKGNGQGKIQLFAWKQIGLRSSSS